MLKIILKHEVVFLLILVTLLAGLTQWLQQTTLFSVEQPETSKSAAEVGHRVALIGDLSCASGKPVTRTTCQFPAVANAISAYDPEAVLVLGDLQYDTGAQQDFANLFAPTWQQLKAISYPVLGNHEYLTTNAQGYFDYWGQTGSRSKAPGNSKQGYYSFDIDAWHLVALNSNCEFAGGCEAASAQAQWLQADLQAHQKNACTLAFWHHPVFTSGKYNGSKESQERGKPFWELLQKYGADVVANGHDHIYERFARQTVNGARNDTQGIREFVVGTGGKELYGFSAQLQPNHDAGTDKAFGFLEMELYKNWYKWSFVDVTGKVLDSGQNICNSDNHI